MNLLSGKKWLLPALIGGGTVVAGVVVAAVLFISGAFLTPVQKVALAAGNTFKEAGVIGDVLSATLVASSNDKSTTRFGIDIEGNSIEAECRYTKADKQVWVNADVKGYPEIEGTLTLTKKELQLSAPMLGDYLFVYDYTADNDGFIFEQVDEEIVEALNEVLAQVYSGKAEDSKALKKMLDDIQEWMDEIDIEEVDKDEFEINGRDVNCAGYEIVLDERIVLEYVEIICDGMVDYLKEQNLDEIEGIDDLYDNLYDEMADEIEGMPEVTITVYMDSNMLAAIIVEVEDEKDKFEILFEGGDYRAQNITVKFAKEKVLQIKGEKDGKVESAELVIYSESYDYETGEYVKKGYTVSEYEYDRKSGDFELETKNFSGNVLFVIEGNIVCNSNGVEITDGEFSMNGDRLDFEFACKKGATIEKMKGDRFDIGTADEDDFEELYKDIQDVLEDMGISLY